MIPLLKRLTLFKPCDYQGPKNLKHRRGYFEGWYYKFISPENRSLAVIPGISLNEKDSHGFIQTIDGAKGNSEYSRFSLKEVKFGDSPFSVNIGDNHFSKESINLCDRVPLTGRVEMSSLRPCPVSLLRPGIMGWYRYVPAMECYHGLISTGFNIKGKLTYTGQNINLTGGRGYMEKDWGTSFPQSYIWLQSNHFPQRNHSFMLSLARIPWLGRSFWGFLGYLDLGEEILTFSTHTASRVCQIKQDKDSLSLTVEGRANIFNDTLKKGESLKIRCSRTISGELSAPCSGSMERRISESIDAVVHLTLKRRGKEPLLLKGVNGGFEAVGKVT